MPLYEHVFSRAGCEHPAGEELTTQMTASSKGRRQGRQDENWGVRSLTYRMNKNQGHFLAVNIDAPRLRSRRSAPGRISEDVIAISPSASKSIEGPSAMMRKADRDAKSADDSRRVP